MRDDPALLTVPIQGRFGMSPLTRRRLAVFRAHRRGFWSLWIFLLLFVLSLFAEFIANDRPLLIRFDGHWYVPVLQDYSEDAFGPEFMPTEADYTDPELQPRDRGEGLDDLAGDPLQLRHRSCKNLPAPAPSPPTWQQPARHRRPGARRAGAGDLRVPHLRAVRLHPDRDLLGRRRSPPARCRASTAG